MHQVFCRVSDRPRLTKSDNFMKPVQCCKLFKENSHQGLFEDITFLLRESVCVKMSALAVCKNLHFNSLVVPKDKIQSIA